MLCLYYYSHWASQVHEAFVFIHDLDYYGYFHEYSMKITFRLDKGKTLRGEEVSLLLFFNLSYIPMNS